MWLPGNAPTDGASKDLCLEVQAFPTLWFQGLNSEPCKARHVLCKLCH